jgi:hypothetical protein
MFSVAQKISMVEARRQGETVSARKLKEQSSHTGKLPRVTVSVMILSLGIIITFMTYNNMFRMTRSIISYQAIKIGKNCKHLLNFQAATQREIC